MIFISRVLSICIKEFKQLLRDKSTFGMVFIIPIMQMTLLGVVVNSDTKNVKTIIASNDNQFVKYITIGLINSSYFQVIKSDANATEIDDALNSGSAKLAFIFDKDFDKKLIRGLSPDILVEADGSDPLSIGNALTYLNQILQAKLSQYNNVILKGRPSSPSIYNLIIHRKFNPEGISNYNTIPGVIGVVLTLTMIMMTAMAIVREKERGNMELLLSTPLSGLNIMLGKVIPYILIGIVQVVIILLAAHFIFKIPIVGNIIILFCFIMLFIATNLCLGLTISAMASNQLQAVQISQFIFLPSLFLSGFMYPFEAMPKLAQYIGEIIPLTHFMRVVRAIILKGTPVLDLSYDIIWLACLLIAFVLLALAKFKKTLD